MHEVVQCLIEARAKVAHRWIQGRAYDHDGGFCTAGAVEMTVNQHKWGDAVRSECWRRLSEQIHLQSNWNTTIPQWNDFGGRTKREVVALFDATIAEAAAYYGENLIRIDDPEVRWVSQVPVPDLVPEEWTKDMDIPVASKSVVTRIRELVGV